MASIAGWNTPGIGTAYNLKVKFRVALAFPGIGANFQRLTAATAEFDNVMFHTLDPEEIPWRDGYFDVVLDPLGTAPTGDAFVRERARVLG